MHKKIIIRLMLCSTALTAWVSLMTLGLKDAHAEIKLFGDLYLDTHYFLPPDDYGDKDENPYITNLEHMEIRFERAYFGLKGEKNVDIGKIKYKMILDILTSRYIAEWEALETDSSIIDEDRYYNVIDNSFPRPWWLYHMKAAYLEWAFMDRVSLSLGVQGTQLFQVQEKMWGYRHVAKSFMDKNKFNSSADLGLNLKIMPFSGITANLYYFNGDGYSAYQNTYTHTFGLNAMYSTEDMIEIGEFILYGVAHYSRNTEEQYREDALNEKTVMYGSKVISNKDYVEGENDPEDEYIIATNASGHEIEYVLDPEQDEDVLYQELRPTYAVMLGFKNDFFRSYGEFAMQDNFVYQAFNTYDFRVMGVSFFMDVRVSQFFYGSDLLALFARYDLNLSDIYDGKEKVDGDRIDPIKGALPGAGVHSLWIGLALRPIRNIEAVFSFQQERRAKYDFEKKAAPDPNNSLRADVRLMFE